MSLKQQLNEALKMSGAKDFQDKTNHEKSVLLKEVCDKEQEKKQTLKEIADKALENGNAKIVEVVASYSRKVNLGNYESQDFFCSAKANIERGVDVQAVAAKLAFECQQAVEYQKSKLQPKEKPF